MEPLEPAVRHGDASGDPVLFLRGGVDSPDKLVRQGSLLASRYTYRGRPAWGISLFSAVNEADELAVLATRLRTYPRYRRIPAAELATVTELLPTFRSPHWTALFPDGTDAMDRLMTDLLGILGSVLENPQYRVERARRR